MNVLGLDFETQGIDAETTNITEVGAQMVQIQETDFGDTYYNQEQVEAFCYDINYPPQTSEVVELTGITDAILKEKGEDLKMVLAFQVLPLIQKADYVMAYNAQFDRAVLEAACKKYGLNPPEKEWLCAMVDVPYPEKFTCGKLSHRAYDHGVLVDPATLHRARQDVDLMFRVTCQYPFKTILAYAKEPWVYLKANIPTPWSDGGVGKAKAKARKFSWEKANGDERTFPKTWVKRVKLSKVENELAMAARLGLLVMKIEGEYGQN